MICRVPLATPGVWVAPPGASGLCERFVVVAFVYSGTLDPFRCLDTTLPLLRSTCPRTFYVWNSWGLQPKMELPPLLSLRCVSGFDIQNYFLAQHVYACSILNIQTGFRICAENVNDALHLVCSDTLHISVPKNFRVETLHNLQLSLAQICPKLDIKRSWK